ncbi:leucine-rich repeat-containing 43 [Brachionus plicatilis]|uniref:Leucine-rich repeat-containing 43 n=1 Tax=Brachionus plicatilis TaxID=10195 RepID=A0A3M7SX92_BRAPC|nr:leucine-rich repeat-containing 43 [Brachionus plicatilis]
MSKKCVSEAFYIQLKSLRLNEYPIIGSYVKKDPRIPNELDEYEKEKVDEIVEMIDLIKDQKSPWYETYIWSRDCDSIRERYIRDRSSINLKNIERYFSNLRLNSLDIEEIDENVKNFVNLEELILSCNLITGCSLSNLPNSVKIFDLSANLIQNIHDINVKSRTSIQHFGLAYNSIENLDTYFYPKHWQSLVSLDLTSNNIQDLTNLIIELENLKNLKVLILSRNPVVLYPGYRGLVIDSLTNLYSLDDSPIKKEERINYQDFKLYRDFFTHHAEILFNFISIRNLVFPELPDFEDEPEIFVFKYVIRFNSLEDSDFMDCYEQRIDSTQEFDPMTNIDLNEKGLVNLKFKSMINLRDFMLKGTRIELVERKIFYQAKNYEPPAEDDVKKKKKTEKKEEKKEVKKKKKTISSLLDNYNQVNVEEKVLANFDLELQPVLDGLTKIIEKKFQSKQKFETANLNQPMATSNKNDPKKGKKNEKASKTDKKKSEADLREPAEQLPLEIDFKFKVLDFSHLKELKIYLDENDLNK